MTEILKKSKRELNREKNIKKLFSAAEKIMREYDYNTVTIRNICSVSGVSYGSFYNLFDSKESFLTEYLTKDFVSFKKNYYGQRSIFDDMNPIEKAVDIFKSCARYNESKGIDFISAFYSPKNRHLFPSGSHTYYCFTPLEEEATCYLEEARKKGLIRKDLSPKTVAEQFCIIFNGVTFNWCISGGTYDHYKALDDILLSFVNTLK